MELVIAPNERTLEFRAGANLLEVLKAHDVPISHSCMDGRCGTCRCHLLAGEVLESGQQWRTPMTGGERLLLACQTVLTEDCVIEIPERGEVVVHPARTVKATVIEFEALTHDIRRLRLKPSKPLLYSPGQHVHLQFTPERARPYSMAGLAADGELEFHLRLVTGGRVTEYLSKRLEIGDTVRVSGPLGAAYLRRGHTGPMLCVAAGNGLAPVLSVLRGARAAGMANPIHVYYGVRASRDLYGLNELRAQADANANLHVHVVVTIGNREPEFRSGLATDAIAQDWERLEGWRAYLFGTPALVEASALLLKTKGIAPEHLHADAFYPTGT